MARQGSIDHRTQTDADADVDAQLWRHLYMNW